MADGLEWIWMDYEIPYSVIRSLGFLVMIYDLRFYI